MQSRILGILESNHALLDQTIDDSRQLLILFDGGHVNAEILPSRFQHWLRIKASFREIPLFVKVPEKFASAFTRLFSPNVNSHAGSWRASCGVTPFIPLFQFDHREVARGVTDPGVGSGGFFLLGSFAPIAG